MMVKDTFYTVLHQLNYDNLKVNHTKVMLLQKYVLSLTFIQYEEETAGFPSSEKRSFQSHDGQA